jgi:hypothetical protein
MENVKLSCDEVNTFDSFNHKMQQTIAMTPISQWGISFP